MGPFLNSTRLCTSRGRLFVSFGLEGRRSDISEGNNPLVYVPVVAGGIQFYRPK